MQAFIGSLLEDESEGSQAEESRHMGMDAPAMQILEHEDLDVLIFEAAGQRYGLPSSNVEELVRAVTIVPLPKAPSIIEGIINVRGTVVPVVDTRKRLRLPLKALEHTDHLILASAGERLFALRVDRALELLRIRAEDLQDTQAVVPGAEYVSLIAKLPGGLVLINNLSTFLSQAESEELDAALSALTSGGEAG